MGLQTSSCLKRKKKVNGPSKCSCAGLESLRCSHSGRDSTVTNMANSTINVIEDQEFYLPNTFKPYYFPLSGTNDSSSTTMTKRKSKTPDIDDFFDQAKPKKTKNVCSTVGRYCQGGMSYVSTEKDERATHLIKLYELNKLSKVPQAEQWKYAQFRVKYYSKEKERHLEDTKYMIYKITKEIAESKNCERYDYKT